MRARKPRNHLSSLDALIEVIDFWRWALPPPEALLRGSLDVSSGNGTVDIVTDCRSSAWGHSLPGAPGVDPLDQLGLDPNVDICGFPCHAGEMGRCRAPPLDNTGQKSDCQIGL